MTPLATALSSARAAARWYSVAFSTSPAAAASRALRIAVFREDLTALLRSRAFSLVLFRLIWDLMFATNEPFQVQARGRTGPRADDFFEECLVLRGHETQPPTLPAAH